jgi:hypothetical protein
VLLTESQMLPSSFFWWGMLLAETDPEHMRPSLEEAATQHERDCLRRMGRSVVPYSEWKRGRGIGGGGARAGWQGAAHGGAGWHPGATGSSRSARRSAARRAWRGYHAAGGGTVGPASPPQRTHKPAAAPPARQGGAPGR